MPQALKDVVAAARRQARLEIRGFILARPELSYVAIGKLFGIGDDLVQGVATEFGLKRKRGPKLKKQPTVQQGE
jgi:hypothetical protein